jgi:site-specific recombinase XerD
VLRHSTAFATPYQAVSASNQAYLFRERKLAAHTVTLRLAALRFFFIQTMKKPWSVADTPYPKKARHLPSILSPEEVALLIDSAQAALCRWMGPVDVLGWGSLA